MTTKGQANPTHNVWAPALPRCITPRCGNLASACCAGMCWTCHAKARMEGKQ